MIRLSIIRMIMNIIFIIMLVIMIKVGSIKTTKGRLSEPSWGKSIGKDENKVFTMMMTMVMMMMSMMMPMTIMMMVRMTMMTSRDMIERSGAYTRDEPVVSLGRTITEVKIVITTIITLLIMMIMAMIIVTILMTIDFTNQLRRTIMTWSTGSSSSSLSCDENVMMTLVQNLNLT